MLQAHDASDGETKSSRRWQHKTQTLAPDAVRTDEANEEWCRVLATLKKPEKHKHEGSGDGDINVLLPWSIKASRARRSSFKQLKAKRAQPRRRLGSTTPRDKQQE